MYLIKHILELVLCQSGTLHVFHGAKFLCHAITVFLPDGLHLLAGELVPNTRIVAQIGLCANNQAGDTRTVVVNLGEPLFPHVLKGGGGGDGEANKEDISLRVGERAQTIIILLTGSIEQTQRVRFIADPGDGGLARGQGRSGKCFSAEAQLTSP